MSAPSAGRADKMEAAADGFGGVAGTDLAQTMSAAGAVVARFGPAGDAALSTVVDSLASSPEAYSDPHAFFAALERTLQEQLAVHGVAIPPKGFSQSAKGDEEEYRLATFAVLGALPAAEVEALAFMVLMLAATSAQEDLAAIMAKVNEINAAKAAQRENLAEAHEHTAGQASKEATPTGGHAGDPPKEPHTDREEPQAHALDSAAESRKESTPTGPPATVTAGQALNDTIDSITGDLDSISEMREVDSLRLQNAMDRLSTLMSTLSNLLKKISDTASQITANPK